MSPPPLHACLLLLSALSLQVAPFNFALVSALSSFDPVHSREGARSVFTAPEPHSSIGKVSNLGRGSAKGRCANV